MQRHVYFYTLFKGFRAASALLAGSPAMWLPLPATPADDAWLVTLKADGVVPGPLASHHAEVRAGSPSQGETVAVPITWRSARADRLLPTLEGDLELSPLADDMGHLAFFGGYRPPLAVVGDVGDRLLGRHIAEACVRQFVLDVGARLESSTLSASEQP